MEVWTAVGRRIIRAERLIHFVSPENSLHMLHQIGNIADRITTWSNAPPISKYTFYSCSSCGGNLQNKFNPGRHACHNSQFTQLWNGLNTLVIDLSMSEASVKSGVATNASPALGSWPYQQKSSSNFVPGGAGNSEFIVLYALVITAWAAVHFLLRTR